jgi:ribonuclease III
MPHYLNSHQNGYHKRQSEHHHYNSPQSKKLRLETDAYTRHSKKASLIKNLPELPSISPQYEKCVFTHASLSSKNPSDSYETLEFLGDAYLEIIASRLIWSLYNSQGFTAARMSQVREMLVKNETLSEYCIAYGLDARLAIQEGSRPADATSKIKLNGDVFEAYVAAVVLSDPTRGTEKAEEWLSALWEEKLNGVNTAAADDVSKGELQKRLSGKGVRLDYIDEKAPIIDKKKGLETYFIGVYLTGWGYDKRHLGSGKGSSKKAAGYEAAKVALRNEEVLNDCKIKKDKMYEERKAEEENGKVDGES